MGPSSMSMYTPVIVTSALELEFIFIIAAAIYIKENGLAICYHYTVKYNAMQL